MSKREIAMSNFKKGYNCSQSVFLAYAKDYGLDEETALRIAASFGAGMGRMRQVCGTVSSMFLVAGLETGSTDPKNVAGKKANYETVRELARMFTERHGSIICGDLLGLNKQPPEVRAAALADATPEARTPEYYKKRPCIELIGDACDILDEYFAKKD